MSFSSVSSANAAPRSPEASEVRKAGPDHDGDSDDHGAKAVNAPPAPTVSATGQKLGQVINATA